MPNYMDAVKKNLDISKSKTLKDAVYEAFRKTIVLGEIPAGERINELEFSDKLNISRTPIRFALDKLAEEKLVERIPGVGTMVIGISIKDAHEIFDIRKALDTLATSRAMKLMTPADFQALKELLEKGDYYNETDQVDLLLDNFSDFNAFIFEHAQMPRLQSIVTELQTYLFYFRDISIRASERRSVALNEHWLIYRGMCNQDIEQIRMIIHEHLDLSLKFIVEEMERHNIH